MNTHLMVEQIGLMPSNPLASHEGLLAKADGLMDRNSLKGSWKGMKEKDRTSIERSKRGVNATAAMNVKGMGSSKPAMFEAVASGRSKPMDLVKEKNESEKLMAGNKRKLEVISTEGKKLRHKVQALDVDDPDKVREGDGEKLAVKPRKTQIESEESKQAEAQLRSSSAGWESFLPQRNIKVLLAEDDDSTRQIVGALLRNSSYEVTAVSNGMQAWEMLDDSNFHFDLVLTDVVMPHLSGVGLLSKIMSREEGNRIPVIMMSAHDSLDIVFRCLSKGAADFLVKPVRKNELKNLWQHVWRCHSLSGSRSGGSRSGSGLAKTARLKSRVGSGVNRASNDRSDDDSSGLNGRGGSDNGSDNGSGTQAAPYVVQKAKADKGDVEEQATSVQKLSNEQFMGQELEMATRREEPKENHPTDLRDRVIGSVKNVPSTSENSGKSGNGCLEDYDSDPADSGDTTGKAIDLIGGFAYQIKEVNDGADSGDGVEGLGRGESNSPENDKCTTSSNSAPLLELSLKRFRVPGEVEEKEERHVLRHSGSSAFSRYSITSNQGPSSNQSAFGTYFKTQSPSTAAGSMVSGGKGQFSRPLEHAGSSKAVNLETAAAFPIHPKGTHTANGQDNTGSSTVGSSAPREGFSQQVKDEAVSVIPRQGMSLPMHLQPHAFIYDGAAPGYGPGLHPVFYAHTGTPQWASAAPHVADRESFDLAPYRDHAVHPARQSFQRQYQQPTSHYSGAQRRSTGEAEEMQAVLNQMQGAPRCGSSNMANSTPDNDRGQTGSSNGDGIAATGNCFASGSGSGSNAIHNQNWQSCMPTQNGECVGNTGVNGAGTGLAAGEVNHELNRSARREAALNKFRQKRKDRCFEKKVRYQSRKRLAEQRPRVRGQFVRQAVYGSNTGQEME